MIELIEYRGLRESAAAQSGRRYVRTESILGAAEHHAAISEASAGFIPARASRGASFIEAPPISHTGPVAEQDAAGERPA